MACAKTECNECGFIQWNVFINECSKCGSRNVDAEHDREFDEPVEDYVDISWLDEE